MKGDRLTPKQERFCLNLLKGMSQREAYIQAGYSSNQLPSTIDENACRMAANSKVTARLNELRNNAEFESVLSRQEQDLKLTEIIKSATINPDTVTVDHALKAIKDLGLRQGVYQATQYNDNRVINFIISDRARKLIEQGIARTGKLTSGSDIEGQLVSEPDTESEGDYGSLQYSQASNI